MSCNVRGGAERGSMCTVGPRTECVVRWARTPGAEKLAVRKSHTERVEKGTTVP